MTTFFEALEELAGSCAVVIDRPQGSVHPRSPQVVYPLDYGYLDGTTTTDGQGVDLFRGTAAGRGVVGALVSVDRGKRDVEIKVLLDCTDSEAAMAFAFLTESLHLAVHALAR